MNTRLQVEHPVTEEVSGYDLVELMIRVAAGEKLPEDIRNKEVPFHGWSMESRVYAEDPLRNFLPSIGGLSKYQEPTQENVVGEVVVDAPGEEESAASSSRDVDTPRVRVDSGILPGSDISMFYDPMISKLVTWAPDREGAIRTMAKALDSYVIRGVRHNVAFCRALCSHPKFVAGDISTDFIKDEFPDGFQAPKLTGRQRKRVIAAALTMAQEMDSADDMSREDGRGEGRDDFESMLLFGGEEENGGHDDGAQFYCGIGLPGTQVLNVEKERVTCAAPRGRHASRSFCFENDDASLTLHGTEWDGPHEPLFRTITEGGGEDDADSTSALPQSVSASDEGDDDDVEEFVCEFVSKLTQGVRVQVSGSTYDVAVLTPREHELSTHIIAKDEVDLSKSLLSPMPGSLISVSVEPGQNVEPGQELAVVEAMKMQNILRAEQKGVVKGVVADAGASLEVDQLILEFE
eukprot:g1604.t1